MKNARRKLEIPMPPAMPCKTPVNCRGETCRNVDKHKTKYACIVDAKESMRIRLEGVPHRYHENHIAAKGINSLSRQNSVHKFIPKRQALKNTECKGSSGKWENWRTYGMAAGKSKKQERGDRRSKEQGQKSSFRVTDESLSSQEFGVRASMSQVQRLFRSPRWHCERWFRIIRSIYWTRIISISNDSRKSHGHYFRLLGCAGQAADAVSAYTQSKWRCTDVIENSKVRMSR